MNQIPEADKGHGRHYRQDEQARNTSEQREARRATRWAWAAVAAVEALFALGLVIAIPIGRVATVLVFALAFVLAARVGALLNTSPCRDESGHKTPGDGPHRRDPRFGAQQRAL